jgi:thiamine-monophosphate kinase
MDEFDQIAALFRPLTLGAPEALDLLDDAAVIPGRPGFDLVVTKDAVVEGIHFLPDDPLDLVARKLLRVNLSDLAAKGAEPFGYFLAIAWSTRCDLDQRRRFCRGLGQDQGVYNVRLLGGDTVSTPGPLTASATLMGWVPKGAMVKRSGAGVGDIVLVSGVIGDGGLGLRAARGELAQLGEAAIEMLATRYRLPEPRLDLRAALMRYATAAADISDGLLADAGHVGAASGLGLRLDLDRLPLSDPAKAWLALQSDAKAALLDLASAGDDYELVCTTRPERAGAFIAAAGETGLPLTPLGEIVAAPGLELMYKGQRIATHRTGWRHG